MKSVSLRGPREDRAFHVVNSLLLVLFGVAAFYPIYFVLCASVSSPNAISGGRTLLFPVGWNMSAYRYVMENRRIWIGYRNSIAYTAGAAALDLTIQLTCAYALSRKGMPGRKLFNTLFIITMYFSGGIIPKYLLIAKLGMLNTGWALIVPGCVNVFNIIIARNFFENTIPDALYEAAFIDGAGFAQFFFRFALPLSGALIAVISLYSIQAHWNAYLGATMYIQDINRQTLQVIIRSITAKLDTTLAEEASLAELVEEEQKKQLMKYCVVVVSSIPLVIIYPFVQRFFIKGVMIGAVKG